MVLAIRCLTGCFVPEDAASEDETDCFVGGAIHLPQNLIHNDSEIVWAGLRFTLMRHLTNELPPADMGFLEGIKPPADLLEVLTPGQLFLDLLCQSVQVPFHPLLWILGHGASRIRFRAAPRWRGGC